MPRNDHTWRDIFAFVGVLSTQVWIWLAIHFIFYRDSDLKVFLLKWKMNEQVDIVSDVYAQQFVIGIIIQVAAIFILIWSEIRKEDGLVRRAPAPKGYCDVCYGGRKTHAAIPCGHLVSCKKCADALRRREKNTCPICRADVQHFNVIFK